MHKIKKTKIKTYYNGFKCTKKFLKKGVKEILEKIKKYFKS